MLGTKFQQLDFNVVLLERDSVAPMEPSKFSLMNDPPVVGRPDHWKGKSNKSSSVHAPGVASVIIKGLRPWRDSSLTAVENEAGSMCFLKVLLSVSLDSERRPGSRDCASMR